MKCCVLFSGISNTLQREFINQIIQTNSFGSTRTIENLILDHETNEELVKNLEQLHTLGMEQFIKISVLNNKQVLSKFQDDDELYDENNDVLYHKNPWKSIELGIIQIPESKKTPNFPIG